MNINLSLDTSGLLEKTLREQKRFVYAVSNALNGTAAAIQTAERVNLDQKFTLRRAAFVYRLVKIFAFASPTKNRPFAEVGIDDSKKNVLLAMFEAGGTKAPVVGRNVAIPITGEAARPTFPSQISAAFTFNALRFRREGASGVFEGRQGTYLLPGVGVFERVSSKVTKLIYAFKHTVTLKRNLGFIPLAEKVFAEEFEVRFRREFPPD